MSLQRKQNIKETKCFVAAFKEPNPQALDSKAVGNIARLVAGSVGRFFLKNTAGCKRYYQKVLN